MVGRDVERGELADLLQNARTGFTSALVEGAVGIGKTTLWEEALRLAAAGRWHVLAARPVQSEIRLTYVGLGDLLAKVDPAVLDELAPPQRRALEIALLRAEPQTEPLEQRAVAVGFLSVVQILARSGPVLIAVDDAQWLDPPSAAVLEFAARRLEAETVRLLLTQRLGSGMPFSPAALAPELRRMELGPLSLGALHQLIRMHTGAPLARRRLIELARLSGGNPLFALELVRAGQSGDSPPLLPTALGEALLARVSALPQQARGELLSAALAARPAGDLVDQAALAKAEEAGIVRVAADGLVEFTHPLFAWAALSLSSQEDRRSAHLRLAERSLDPEERVRHRALAVEEPDAGLAAELDETAAFARSRGAPASGADLLWHARRLTPHEATDEWARRAAEEIPLLLSAGDCEQAWTLGQEALRRLPPGRARAAVLIEAVDSHPGATELCLQALAESEGDETLEIRAHGHLVSQYLFEFDVDAAARHADIAVELARAHGNPVLLDCVLTKRALLMIGSGAADPTPDLEEVFRLEHLLEHAALSVGRSARFYRGIWSALTDDLDGAKALFEQLLVEAVEEGDEHGQMNLRAMLGIAELRAGNGGRARGELESAIELADLMEFGQARGAKRAWLARLMYEQGEFEAARATAGDAMSIAESIGDRPTQLLCLATLLALDNALDEPTAALSRTVQIRSSVPVGVLPPLWLEFEEEEVRALVAAGSLDAAAERLEELRRRNDGRPLSTLAAARGASILLAAQGQPVDAARVLQELVEDELDVTPFEAARTYLLEGQLERRAKQRASARGSLDRAAALFEQLGAAGWVEKTRAESSRLGLRRSRDELTETEQRVAELAAKGRSNREIASALFISRRTVEANIAHIYRKLGVNTRAELAYRVGNGSSQVA
jgi:DNA-binding CsgD family transcriptional regulator